MKFLEGKGPGIGGRIGLALLAALVFACIGLSDAWAQSASCSRLFANLQALNRNGDFRNVDQASADSRGVQADERDAESAYIRTGCQQAQQQGLPQPPQCRVLAHQILQDRARLAQMARSLANGDAVAQQREQVLQQIARFGCNQQGARPSYFGDAGSDQPPARRRNFLDDLFGGFNNPPPPDQGTDNYGDQGDYNGEQQVEDPYAGQQAQNTIRTVCVRASDGYYWPISYATVRDYIPQDAQTCQAECPDQQVDLYFYDNPGQEPEQMVNAEGMPYTALPTAFAYRKQFDLGNTCKPQVTVGQISLQDMGGGMSRAMVTYDGDTFPLPLRDPRTTQGTTTAAAARIASIDIPLPRPRPASPDATAAPVHAAASPATTPVATVPNRVVKVGDKLVRIVGPDTPYAPPTLAGSSG